MSNEERVLCQRDLAVVTITLNRPERRNALDNQTLAELSSAVETAAHDKDIRTVVLAGAGKGFCAGQDLEAFETEATSGAGAHILAHYKPLIVALRSIEKPVIAAVNGIAAGAGASIALACDLRVMAEDAALLMAFSRIGLVPDSGASWFLARHLGFGRAFELAVEGSPLSANRCLELGLANKVVPGSQLLKEATSWAQRLSQAPTYALGLTKRAMNLAMETGLAQALDFEASLQQLASQSADFAEGVKAFREKRPPNFSGK